MDHGTAVPASDAIRAALEGHASGEGPACVDGVVTDEAGGPIEAAVVALFGSDQPASDAGELAAAGQLALTDGEGRFRVTRQMRLPGGSATIIVVRHREYVGYRQEVTLPSTVRITLRRGLTIGGRVVCGLDRIPVPGAAVVARGAGAAVGCGMPTVIAPPRARVQAAISGVDGRFVIDGCESGGYEVDVVAEGLASLYYRPPGQTDAATGTRWARAGESSLELMVMPLAVTAVRLVDAVSGGRIDQADVELRAKAPAGYTRVFPFPEVVANGRAFGGRRRDDVMMFGFLAPEWPLPRTVIDLRVRAEGYEEFDGSASLMAIGSDTVPEVIRMRPVGDTGLCRCELRDREG
ncbi:MAG TPA: carboxypeptidase-like regulatory domain-containing protein, partial [Planctomycetota bacterium]|nr:carboxypeptidase-like regulatory domain-containing protein [Planctomycetota bacterium]